MKNKTKGISWLLVSAFGFSVMNLFVRLSGDLPTLQKNFFRNCIALIVALILVLKQRQVIQIPKGQFKFLILRSILGFTGMIANFYTLDKINLSDASVLNKLAPFAVIIFSCIFLKEKIHPLQIICLFVAFSGVLLITKPVFNFSEFAPYLIGIIGGIAAGAAYTCVHYLSSKGVGSAVIVFFFSSFSCLLTLPFFLLNPQPMSLNQIVFLLLAGLFASLGQFGVTLAYRFAAGRDISIYDYSSVLFSALWGFIFLQQIPNRWSILGYFIVFAAFFGVYLFRKKSLTPD